MLIERQNVGAHGRRIIYALKDDGREIASFDTMEDAALVLRYLNGGNMDKQERQHALEALKNKEK